MGKRVSVEGKEKRKKKKKRCQKRVSQRGGTYKENKLKSLN